METNIPSDAEYELIKAVGDLEEPLYDIRDFAEALSLMAEGLEAHASGAISRVARSIKETAEAIQEAREKLFHALHQRRADPEFQADTAPSA